MWLFVNCLIENPAFDSQTKEALSTKASNFGSEIEFTKKFIKDLLETGVVSQIIEQIKSKLFNKMNKNQNGNKRGRIAGIPKLDDANFAGNLLNFLISGSRHGENCTLILTEGDSAKSLAMAGIEVIGRDEYGCFPLRGKFLNVRD